MDQVQDAVGGLLARPPLKRAKPEEDGEGPSEGRLKGKGKGEGKGENKNQTQQLAALQQTADRGTAHLVDSEARVTIAGAGQRRPISALFASR